MYNESREMHEWALVGKIECQGWEWNKPQTSSERQLCGRNPPLLKFYPRIRAIYIQRQTYIVHTLGESW